MPNENLTDGVWCVSEVANELGFETGDRFLAADGEKIERFSDVLEKIILSKVITVERNGINTDIEMHENVVDKFLSNERQLLFYPRVPSFVSSIVKNSNAEKAGLKKKDILVGINNKP